MSKGSWLGAKPKPVKRAYKNLTDMGMNIGAYIEHPDGSFEFRTQTAEEKPANDLDRELEEFGARRGQA
jgi:hypothetical protein